MKKLCQVTHFSCPADINASRRVEEKVATYGPLIRNLQIMYNDYRFKILLVVVGALGTIANATKESLKEIKFSKTEKKQAFNKLAEQFCYRKVKICKTFLKLMYGTGCSWILPSRQLPAQSQLDNIQAMLSKRFFQSCMTDFGM